MIEIHLVESTASTNDDAKLALREGAPTGTVIVARMQTAGRGRQGRAWHAAPGDCLMGSLVINRPLPARRAALLSLGAGLGVYGFCMQYAPNAQIKWPNDVLVGGRKLAGILCESVVRGDEVVGAVIGVGCNMHAHSLPEDLRGTATSIAEYTDAVPELEAAAADMFARVLHLADDVLARGLGPHLARLNRAHALAGREVLAASGARGLVREIDDEGRLVVQTPTSTERWSSGEVHLVRA